MGATRSILSIVGWVPSLSIQQTEIGEHDPEAAILRYDSGCPPIVPDQD